MHQNDTKRIAADDPTAEEQGIELDGTNTYQLDNSYRIRVVTASEADSGTVEFDERGQPRWKYNENPPNRDPETTFNLLKALENAAIVFEEPPAPAPAPQPSARRGFNPYDTAPAKPAPKK
jgi:hypothetical protein